MNSTWIPIATALVILMTPALGLFYGGLVRKKNVLSTLMYSFFTVALISVAGLVGGTPAAGYVEPLSAIGIGLITSAICFVFTEYVVRGRVDDSLDVFGVHGVGGIVGALLTGVFASPGLTEGGGLLNGNVHQFLVQCKAAFAVACFAGAATLPFCWPCGSCCRFALPHATRGRPRFVAARRNRVRGLNKHGRRDAELAEKEGWQDGEQFAPSFSFLSVLSASASRCLNAGNKT